MFSTFDLDNRNITSIFTLSNQTKTGNNMGQIVKPQDQLGWEIVSEPIRTESGLLIDGYKSIRRSDNDHVLNVVKNSYSPMTNEAFTGLITQLGEVTGFKQAGFTTFKKGGIILGFLENKEKVQKIGDHEILDYMVVGNSHDFSSSIFVGTSSVLVRCTNAFSRIKKGKGLSVPHTKNKQAKIDNLVKYFEMYQKEKELVFTAFNDFTGMSMTPDLQEQFISEVLQINELGELSTRKSNQRSELVECINREKNDLGNNLWAVFNGVTYWTTHVKDTKADKLFGSVLGGMADINERAFKSAVELIQE